MHKGKLIDKERVQRQFARAIVSYDTASHPQQRIADDLIGWINHCFEERGDLALPMEELQDILEVGCGTGLLTERLIALLGVEGKRYHLNDLVPEMGDALEEKLRGLPYHFRAFDAEESEWAGRYGLIASNCCIQWWHEPLAFLEKGFRALESGGILAVTTFLPDNLPELASLLPRALPYPELDAYESLCQRLGFRYYQLSPLLVSLSFPSLLALLQHLKATGANGVAAPSSLWTPQMLRRKEAELRAELALAVDAPLPLTYHALSLIAIK